MCAREREKSISLIKPLGSDDGVQVKVNSRLNGTLCQLVIIKVCQLKMCVCECVFALEEEKEAEGVEEEDVFFCEKQLNKDASGGREKKKRRGGGGWRNVHSSAWREEEEEEEEEDFT